MNIVLLGLRCSGKSTVARLVALRLTRPEVDLDALTIRALGAASVAEAWRTCGQSAFREAEVRVLVDVLSRDDQVIALGGGTPTAPGASDLLRAARHEGRAVLVYLRADAGTLRTRLSAGETSLDRPPVLGDDAAAEVEALLNERDPLYAKLADHILDATQAPAALADAVVSLCRQ